MRVLSFVALILVGCMACAKRPVTPTRESRRAIDTLYSQRVFAMQPSMDTFCHRYGDSIYHVAVDSMLQERMAEMKELVQ
jgi:hypothetical protein